MINALQSLPVGNAVKLWLSAPAGSRKLRVLRKTADTFAGHDDPAAFVAYEGDEDFVVDIASIVNGTPYFYRSYSFNGTAWADGDSRSSTVTPGMRNQSTGPDALSVVRDRLALGLAAEVQAGNLSPKSGLIQVLTAPPQFDNTSFPVVTVHLRNDAPSVRSLGELEPADLYDETTGEWADSEGWLAQVNLDIVGWVVANPDERIALRTALKKILLGNLPVFDSVGMTLIQFSFSDVEDLETYASPMYQVMVSFSCMAPSLVTENVTATLIENPVATGTLID